MAAGYCTAMPDVLTFLNGCVSSCFTSNVQEAQVNKYINRLSSLNFFCKDLWLLLLQVLMLRKWISHCQNRRPVYLFLQILWKNPTSVSSYHQSFWHMTQKLGEQLRLFHPIFYTDGMESLFLGMFSDKEYTMTKDKVSYYVNYCFCF